MNSTIIRFKTKKAFTIVELLTVMSVIVILIGLLVPALTQVRQFAYEVKQKAQLHSIDTAIEAFHSVMDYYPDSDQTVGYCGAMKLAEAMMGQDLLGFHPDSVFNAAGTDSQGRNLYNANTISARKNLFLPIDNANAFRLTDIYLNTGTLDPNLFVLCDVFRRVQNRHGAGRIGMPILYYKADTAKTKHDFTHPDDSVYNYKDNSTLVGLGMPFTAGVHPLNQMYDKDNNPIGPAGLRFYLNTKSDKVTSTTVPVRSDSYMLISAGNDGLYGTRDDICNFEWKYLEYP